MTPNLRLARLAISLITVWLPVSGCVCESEKNKEAANRPRELAVFDFVDRPEISLLDLWPTGPDAPQRKKRQLTALPEGVELVATTDGPDPYFVWDFETPVAAADLSVELRSEQVGRLQLFWTTEDCKVYEERCSTVAALGVGDQTVDFVLDPTRPLRGVRLDLPETRGIKLAFRTIRLLSRPRLSAGYEGRADHTKAARSPDGLQISCASPDPWVVFSTPWLIANQVQSVEIELRTQALSEPRLYWRTGACPNFSELCQVRFERKPGALDVFSAELGGAANWSGKIDAVRLDPGDDAGVYLLRRLVFVRASAKS
jgi:hypothetical protein